MKDESGATAALKFFACPDLAHGTLSVTQYSNKTAANSTGAMGAIKQVHIDLKEHDQFSITIKQIFEVTLLPIAYRRVIGTG